MNDSKLEFKVGLFVLGGLILIGALVLNFSKGITLFQSTYTLKIQMPTVAGLKPTADVMMSGVTIGKVANSELEDDGRSVMITAKVLSRYKIPKDSKFHIDALGFLGDQYVEVTPEPAIPGAARDYFKDGDSVVGEAPFNMQEAVRSTAGLLDSAKQTMKDIDAAVTNVNRTVLSGATLSDFMLSLSNIESLSEDAMAVVNGAKQLIGSNSVSVHQAVTNLELFSEKANTIADNLSMVVSTNGDTLTETLKNLRDTSASFKQVAADLQAGQGVAGGLLKDEHMKMEVADLVSNANVTAESLAYFTSNLNKEGIWRMLWRPKPVRTNSVSH